MPFIRQNKGGIHPLSKKENTKKKPLMTLEVPPTHLILPLRCPSGYQLRPVVQKGDRVRWGEMVAVPEEEEGVPLYSGVSGKVVEIGQEPHPLFGWESSLVIENDFENRQEIHQSYPNPEDLSQEQLLAIIKERGVRGMSGKDHPIHHKIRNYRGKIDRVIINVAECEPYLTGDHRLLLERQDLVVAGAKIIAHILGAVEIVVAMQGDKLDAIEDLEKTLGWDKSWMRIRTLPTRYPFGEAKQVVRLVTGTEIPSGEGCAYAGCAVFNIASTHAVGEAVVKGLPQTHRAITVAGGMVQRPRNFWVPIGTPLSCLFENAGKLKETPALVLLGGPMTGQEQQNLSAPMLVNSPGLLALGTEEVPGALLKKQRETTPCIRCGHCLTVCPMHLRPYLVYQQIERPRRKKLESLQPQDCIHCGCCNYRCPAGLPLAQAMEKAGQFLLEGVPPTAEEDVKIYIPLPKKRAKKRKQKKTSTQTKEPGNQTKESPEQGGQS